MYVHDQTEIKHDVLACVFEVEPYHMYQRMYKIYYSIACCSLICQQYDVWHASVCQHLAGFLHWKDIGVSCWALLDWILPESGILGLVQWLLVNNQVYHRCSYFHNTLFSQNPLDSCLAKFSPIQFSWFTSKQTFQWESWELAELEFDRTTWLRLTCAIIPSKAITFTRARKRRRT